jgi:hypothetical protein
MCNKNAGKKIVCVPPADNLAQFGAQGQVVFGPAIGAGHAGSGTAGPKPTPPQGGSGTAPPQNKGK